MERYYIFIFNNLQEIIEVEKYLSNEKVKVEIIPAPNKVTISQAGFVLKVPDECMEFVKKKFKIKKSNIYIVEASEGKKRIIKKW